MSCQVTEDGSCVNNVCQLQHLRSLHIWLDHDDKSSWSIIKERLALNRVITTLTAHMQVRYRDESLAHLDIIFNLPKLHPGIARPNTHFVQESAPPPFTIEWRIRQRYHCKEGVIDDLSVRYNADFPVMHQLLEFLELEMNREPNMNGKPHMTLQEVEEMEKELWENGTDVNRFMMEMSGDGCFEEVSV